MKLENYEKFKPMILSSFYGYNFKSLLSDITSGLIVAIIALPLSIALALASGVGPAEGLYTAIVAGFIISLLGGTKMQIAGPTAAFTTIVASIIAKQGIDVLVYSTIFAGILLIIFGVFNLGNYIRYIPIPIVTGFTAGVGITIFLSQLKDFFSLQYDQPIESFRKVTMLIDHFDETNKQAVLIGLLCLLILSIWPNIRYLGSKIPASILVVGISIGLNKLLGLNLLTIGDVYGEISNSLPSPSLPSFDGSMTLPIIGNGITIAILAAIESLLSAVAADNMTGDKHRSNTELIAQGIGNIGSVIFGGIPATGAIARTAANIKNGAVSPISGIVQSIILLLILLVFMPFAAMIPMTTIAAILFSVAWQMNDLDKIYDIIISGNIRNIIEMLMAMFLTVVYNLIIGISIALVFHAICTHITKKYHDEGWVV